VTRDGDYEAVRKVVGAALASLEANRRRIDDLNVYPVPDGDTGTNLTMTMRSVAEAVEDTSAAGRESLARDVARGALMGARGNSGVILSQIVRGATDVLGATSGSAIDPATAARALRGASDAAYRAVRRPVEGTMLSVIRELAEEAEERAAESPALGSLLVDLVRRGEAAVARTPEQLQVLRDAGVVDAGGAGLVEIVRGIAAAVSGESVPAPPPAEEHPGVDAIHQELSEYRYCTTFLIEGDALDREKLEEELERMGDSLLVVGDENAIKVHVHTDDPGKALSCGTAVGTIDRVEIANMHEQIQQREERLLSAVPDPATQRAETGVVAVVAGD
jgi:DAK2 domain fusion protein YloV